MAGPFDEINDLIAGFSSERLRTPAESALTSATIEARNGVLDCFLKAQDPDGNPWPALARPHLRGGSDPLRDRGLLMGSIESEAEGMELHVFTSRKGAALQNYGGTIVPVNVKFLTIPATLEAYYAGRAPDFPRQLFPHINKTGTGGVLVDEDDAVQYYLTKKSIIPKREFIGFPQETIDIIMSIVADGCLDAMKAGGP